MQRPPSPSGLNLPPPSPEALALSNRLRERIMATIEAEGGWLAFERYMEMVLYEPGLGYYSNPGHVFGAAGDFVTAPELTPLFGATVARQVARWLRDERLKEAPAVLEVGAGSGKLAVQLLNALDNAGFSDLRYLILELSAERRQQQRTTLMSFAPGLMDRVTWLTQMPDSFSGVVIGNEVLDAMPVQVFEWLPGDVREMGVVVRDGALAWGARPAGEALASTVNELMQAHGVVARAEAMLRPLAGEGRSAIADAGADGADAGTAARTSADVAGDVRDTDVELPPYRSERCPAQGAWLSTLAGHLDAGVVLLLDYGYPAREYYHPQRTTGTLMCHYRHRAHADPFLWPGLNDLTAHVDFSALLKAGEEAGLTPLGYVSMAAFLLNAGLLEELDQLPREPGKFWFAQAQAVQQLLSEAQMGEVFKVIAFTKQMASSPSDPGFASSNRLGRLL